MTKENANFIANLLQETLKKETLHYNSNHSIWVNDLIKATREFFDDNGFYCWEISRLEKNYQETKEYFDQLK